MILTDSFWAKVEQDGDCWRWTGAKTGRGGYGCWGVNGSTKSVHRLTYSELRADIPDGLHIDHLCRNAWCCNPWHLEPVTQQVNNRRRGHRLCDHGESRAYCPRCHPLPVSHEPGLFEQWFHSRKAVA